MKNTITISQELAFAVTSAASDHIQAAAFIERAVMARIDATTGPELDGAGKGKVITAKFQGPIWLQVNDWCKANAVTKSEFLVRAACAYLGINRPEPRALAGEFPVSFDLSAKEQKRLDAAVKRAKISKSEFVRRALADAVKGETND